LVEWVRSQPAHGEVGGYVDHFWNGITCLQFAKVVETMIQKQYFWKGVRHIFSPRVVTKYELLGLISSAYGRYLNIEKALSPKSCNRVLDTVYSYPADKFAYATLPWKFFDIPDLFEQIDEMRHFDL